jgi:hypothetical protein
MEFLSIRVDALPPAGVDWIPFAQRPAIIILLNKVSTASGRSDIASFTINKSCCYLRAFQREIDLLGEHLSLDAKETLNEPVPGGLSS